ncbi:hypothetical protein WR25_24089 isoform B [Diploscapter pachys]|uniref:LSM domain-containing protein n=1 Tax=Diploscapter pachys TaxID=2018661 RepID=A0A2A2K8M2_9BILA|nr:hypothetical protein WR25_24089 isoform B [Diploscapter pachys]
MISENQLRAYHRMVGRPVKVTLKNGKECYGNLVSVDPITHNHVVAQIRDNQIKNLDMIMSDSVRDMVEWNEPHEDCLSFTEENSKLINAFFKHDTAPPMSEDEIQEQKKKLITFLRSHTLNVIEREDGSITVADTLVRNL